MDNNDEQENQPTALPSRKPSRSRPLDDRSVKILRNVIEPARFVTSDDLHAIFPIKENTLKVQLKTLTRGEYLTRPFAQKYLEHDRGRPPLVYALGHEGAKFLGVPFENPHTKILHLEHGLLVSRVYLTFLQGALLYPNRVDFSYWQREPEMPARYLSEFRTTKTIQPDAVLDYNEPNKKHRLYIECETGTIPRTRTTGHQSSWLRKVLYYQELFKLTQDSSSQQFPKFRVLVIIKENDLEYLESLRAVCRNTDPNRYWLDIFWFILGGNVTPAAPETMLFEPFWFTPSSDDGKTLL